MAGNCPKNCRHIIFDIVFHGKSLRTQNIIMTVFFQTWHLISWWERKTDEKIRRVRLRWLMFTNQFDNHSSVQYQSDAKWVGEQKGIIHFCLNSIASNLFIIRPLTYNPQSRSAAQFFFRSRPENKCKVWKKSLFPLLLYPHVWKLVFSKY